MTLGETPRAIRDLGQRDACRVAMGGVIDRIDVSASTSRNRINDLGALGSAGVSATIIKSTHTLPVDQFDHHLVDTEGDPDE